MAEYKEFPTVLRTFATGATRDADDFKYDYEGFLSPIVLERYGQYMNLHRKQSDGTLRDSDNWTKGIPVAQYAKSLIRHVIDVWKIRRGYNATDWKTGDPVAYEDALCAIIFNAMGWLHELLKEGKMCRDLHMLSNTVTKGSS